MVWPSARPRRVGTAYGAAACCSTPNSTGASSPPPRRPAPPSRSASPACGPPRSIADPALAIAAATTTTSRVTLGTNVILAFTRNPMSVAMQAWELQRASQRSLRARSGDPGEAAHHAALLDAVGRARRPAARVRRGAAPHLRGVPGRPPDGLPGPLLPPHVAAPDVQPGPDRAPAHPDRVGRRRPAAHRPGRRARRPLPAARLHQRRLPGPRHAAGARAWAGGVRSHVATTSPCSATSC